MMQFYKKRDFSALIGDTFLFFKENGKNYFKNYILINGLLLIIMLVLFVLGYREVLSLFINGNLEGQSYYFEAYFQENQIMLVLVSIVIFALFILTGLINYSYPIFYMKRISETGDRNIKADHIISDIKNDFGRIIVFFLGLIFIVMPVAVLVIGITYILIFIIIGILLMFFVFPVVMNVINFFMFDYYHTRRGFWGSLSYALRAQFSYPNAQEKTPFWKYWASIIVIYMIIQVITSIFTIIPVMIMVSSLYTMEQSGNVEGNFLEGGLGVIFFVSYAVSIFVSLILSNLIYVNTGFLYYDSRTDLHRKEDLMEIETIGNGG